MIVYWYVLILNFNTKFNDRYQPSVFKIFNPGNKKDRICHIRWLYVVLFSNTECFLMIVQQVSTTFHLANFIPYAVSPSSNGDHS